MEILALWAICGAFSAVIAQSKGRDTVLWAAIGVATGIIGLIWIACLPAINKPDAG